MTETGGGMARMAAICMIISALLAVPGVPAASYGSRVRGVDLFWPPAENSTNLPGGGVKSLDPFMRTSR
jgi:hypothetical protein